MDIETRASTSIAIMASTSVKAPEPRDVISLGVETRRRRPESIEVEFGKFEWVFKRGRELAVSIGLLRGDQTPYNVKGGQNFVRLNSATLG